MLAAVGPLVAWPVAASAQAVRGQRVALQGGGSLPTGHANVFSGNDDASVGPLDIGFQLNFFGITHTQLYLNNNGNVTFGGATPVFTPFGLTGDLGVLTGNPDINSIIAPFFGDVDTRALRDRAFVDALGNPIARPAAVGLASFGAYDASSAFGQLFNPGGPGTGPGHDVFSVTWSDVGFYSGGTVGTNTFQLNLIRREDTGSGNFDIEFNYDTMEWEAGQASGSDASGLGGVSAHVGFSAGTGVAGTFVELAGSGVNGAFVDGGASSLIASAFGSPLLGRYVFQVRSGGGGVPGESQENPALPESVIPGDPATGEGPTYVFRGFGNGRWADPPDTYGFLFEGMNGTLFTGLGLPTGYDPFDICWGPTFASCATGVLAGSSFDFVAIAGGAQSAFQILGINPLVDSSNPNGFPTQLFFTTATGDFDMTPLLVPTVATPEPRTWMLLGAGLVALVVARRRARVA